MASAHPSLASRRPTLPDIMNDPDYDPGPASSDKADEPDTCRICRGDGTREEPLFYPCKCSGSIKFVHQDCLMEWLSHSQKKHCELCKTPFRFTKLYHPHMPTQLPTGVFLRRAVVHVLRHLLTWARGLLVGSVWLLWLPWCMRVIWRALFWCGDGGFAGDLHLVANIHRQRTALDGADAVNTSATANASASPLPAILSPVSQTLNMSAGEPTAYTLFKKFLFGFGPLHSELLNMSLTNATENATAVMITHRQSSLLSNVSFFKSLTSRPSINRLILDVIEGQIITVVVVIAFILIFLIREWVVQQQPVMNLADIQPQVHAPAPVELPIENEADEPVQDEIHQHDHQDDGDEPQGAADNADSTANRFRFDFAADSSDDEDDEPLPPAPPVVRENLYRIPDAQVRDAVARRKFEKANDLIHAMDPLAQRVMGAELGMWIHHMSEAIQEVSQEAEQRERLADEVSEWLDGVGYLPIDHPYGLLGERLDDAATSSEGPSSKQRPNMPGRGKSLLAAQIRRELEEGARTVPSLSPAEPSSEPGAEAHSENSDGSWQQVFKTDDNEIGESASNASPLVVHNESGASNTHESGAQRAAWSLSTERRRSAGPAESESGPSHLHEIDDNIRASSAESSPTIAPGNEPQQAAGPVANTPAIPAQAALRETLWERLYDWLWGDIPPAIGEDLAHAVGNEEHVVQNIADEDPFVQRNAGIEDDLDAPAQDPQVAEAAAQAGIDINAEQDAIEDAEDLEGIMELIGMQGPIVGLFQNALFSAVLISATVAVAVWVPYLWGKVVLLSLGRPVWLFLKVPLRLLSAAADLIVDSTLFLGAAFVYWSIALLRLVLPMASSSEAIDSAASTTRTIAESAIERISKVFLVASSSMNSDYLHLSANSHAALRSLQQELAGWISFVWDLGAYIYGKVAAVDPASIMPAVNHVVDLCATACATALSNLRAALPTISTTKGLSVTLQLGNSTATPVDPAFEYWTAWDRVIAIVAGYVFFAVAGALYLKRGTPFTSSQNGRRVEGIISDVLQQAGGVLKVILIISIEMLAFPLYCGVLLDFALLPLFEDTTVATRLAYAHRSPWTAGFVHWFVGTCYMFHFALFVSMCRKIMRTGVLYFIRDPDDPTFHPVRDVLERSVTGQLRKIAFSAFVYGALVICCLGGVVWTLHFGFDGVLPIHWATNDPSMEFPLDLLFFNFLTPLVVKFLKPSDALHEMYSWWFKKCARALRLSDFLFGEKNLDERGHHVRRTWTAWFKRQRGDAEKPVIGEDRRLLADDRNIEVYFMFDGKYVRAPASDQVRVPRGQTVFVEVDVFDNRVDGATETGGGIHDKNSSFTTTVYIPPWFRIRICLFVLAIWLFAALTGVGVTVIPLLFGRRLFAAVLPAGTRTNDIYAFATGIYIFGGIAYGLCHLQPLLSSIKSSLRHPFATTYTTITVLCHLVAQAASIAYVYGALIILLPALFALFLEFYVLIPLHAYLGPGETHVVHIIQDWSLGFLYARIAGRFLLWNHNSLVSRALRAVVRNGYAHPDARLATRAFVVPVACFFAATLLLPLGLARVIHAALFGASGPAASSSPFQPRSAAADAAKAHQPLTHHVHSVVDSPSSVPFVTAVYPVCLAVAAVAWGLWALTRATERWRARIKDEVYLIGERLHNLGERRAPPPPPPAAPMGVDAGVIGDEGALALRGFGDDGVEGEAVR
ncbi:RING finger membrane protein [Phyllosticta citribraziliensis]|uniref:RING-type E3 ubiquitin transferase n=1 Tax=Phyllosticta citribraziliensis TaxID=989973 RepID=A0ABR1LNU0_9PEZI